MNLEQIKLFHCKYYRFCCQVLLTGPNSQGITILGSFINRSNLFVFKVEATKIKIKVETYRKF